MLPRAYLTVNRSDLPKWLAWPSGELFIGRRRVALLVGGRPRQIQIPSGEQVFSVVIYSIMIGAHTITHTLIVEDGGNYRYRCRLIPGKRKRALSVMTGLVFSIATACWIGWLTVPLLRDPMLHLTSQALLAMPHVNPALIPLTHRSVLAATSKLSGVIIGGALFLWAIRKVRVVFWSQCLYCIERVQ
jgi:hypothetical protein